MTSKQIEKRLTDWLLFKPVSLIAPYLRANYGLQGRTLTMKRPFRKPITLRIDDLDEIGVEATDQGPFVEDVFWILRCGGLRIRIGEPHLVFRQLMDRVGSLPGFDWRPFLEAMTRTENSYFVCWRRGESSATLSKS